MDAEQSVARILVIVILSWAILPSAEQSQRRRTVDVQLATDTTVPQVERGQRGEITVFGRNLIVKSVEITPSEGVIVQEVRETAPAAVDRRQQAADTTGWTGAGQLAFAAACRQHGSCGGVEVSP